MAVSETHSRHFDLSPRKNPVFESPAKLTFQTEKETGGSCSVKYRDLSNGMTDTWLIPDRIFFHNLEITRVKSYEKARKIFSLISENVKSHSYEWRVDQNQSQWICSLSIGTQEVTFNSKLSIYPEIFVSDVDHASIIRKFDTQDIEQIFLNDQELELEGTIEKVIETYKQLVEAEKTKGISWKVSETESGIILKISAKVTPSTTPPVSRLKRPRTGSGLALECPVVTPEDPAG